MIPLVCVYTFEKAKLSVPPQYLLNHTGFGRGALQVRQEIHSQREATVSPGLISWLIYAKN